MKLVCSKPQLVDIINTVQRAIAPKTSLPILECIKIDANGDGNVVFTGNNIDICIEYNTECTVTEGGTIALASKMFGEIVRRLKTIILTLLRQTVTDLLLLKKK